MLQVNFEPTLKLTCPNNYLTCVKKKWFVLMGAQQPSTSFFLFPPCTSGLPLATRFPCCPVSHLPFLFPMLTSVLRDQPRQPCKPYHSSSESSLYICEVSFYHRTATPLTMYTADVHVHIESTRLARATRLR
jgi:hypothetical protein